jgi:hypothetical protein
LILLWFKIVIVEHTGTSTHQEFSAAFT